MGGVELLSIGDENRRKAIEQTINQDLAHLEAVSHQRRGQFYEPGTVPPSTWIKPHFANLPEVLVKEQKKNDWVQQLGISDEDLQLMVWIGIQKAVNLKAETPTDEATICIANGMCIGVLSKYTDKKTVEQFIVADQKGKEEIFNGVMNGRLGTNGKDYYAKVKGAATDIAVAYKIFANPSDANIASLKEHHRSSLSLIAPYLTYLFSEKERRGRAELQKLIDEYGNQQGF